MSGSYNIILVEDNPITMMSLRLFFENTNFNVIKELTYGEDVVEMTLNYKPDVLVLDIMLKGKVDGIDAAIELRKKSNVPILFVSALSDSQSLERISSISHCDYITKPYDYEELKERVDILIDSLGE